MNKFTELLDKYENEMIKNPSQIRKVLTEFLKEAQAEQLILSGVSHQREQFINLLTSLEKEGGNKFVDKEWIVDNYLKIN